MSAHIELTNRLSFPGGFEELSFSFWIGQGSFTMPLPCQFVSGPVAVTPVRAVDEQGQAVTLRLDRWQVLHSTRKQLLPMVFPSMAWAVRAARGFEDDPGISWDSPEVEIESWAATWAERANATRGGEQ